MHRTRSPGELEGVLRLHSTYRHDLKIYSSDEGRVQMTAAAFAKGFLDLEGRLTPILASLVSKHPSITKMLDETPAKVRLHPCRDERLPLPRCESPCRDTRLHAEMRVSMPRCASPCRDARLHAEMRQPPARRASPREWRGGRSHLCAVPRRHARPPAPARAQRTLAPAPDH